VHLLAIYDIRHPRRLTRVAKVFKDYGIRVQKSKFQLDLSEANFLELRTRIATIIDHDADGVKYIPLCESCRAKVEIIGLGRYVDPETDFIVF